MSRRYKLIVVGVLVVFLTAACGPSSTEVPMEEEGMVEPSPAEVSSESGQDEAVVESAEEETESTEPEAAPTEEEMAEPGLEALPPEPQVVPFVAADGYEQTGVYHPGAQNPGPLVILMHWAPGDQSDWDAIAPWMQNRGLTGPEAPDPSRPWLDSSWFPELGEENSFGVFTFSFRGCSAGCSEFDRSGWLNDALGAFEAALALPGVDPEKIILIGASIGADGVIDACGEGCLGALSFSPGDYLGVNYAEAVQAVEQMGVPAWCVAAEGDTPSYNACSGAEGEMYRSVIHPGSEHGMALFLPDTYDPDSLELIVEFLDLTFGLK